MLSRLPSRGLEASQCRQRDVSSAWHPPSWQCSCPRARHARREDLLRTIGAMAAAPASGSLPTDADGGGTPVIPLPAPSSTTYEEGQFVEVGKIAGAFGIKGEVRIEISTDNPKQRFGLPGKRIFLRPPAASGLLARMQGGPEQGMLALTTGSAKFQVLSKGEQAWLVKFKELKDRSQAEQLLGYALYIPLADRERLRDPDEFWVQDLVGCRAFLKGSSAYVGRVLDVISGTGTHDTLILQLLLNKDDIINSRNRQCMIPFAKAICPSIDRKLKQLVIDPPEGLLDMFTYKAMRKKLTDEQKAERMLMLQNTPLPVLGQATAPASAAPPAPAAPPAAPKVTNRRMLHPPKPDLAASNTDYKKPWTDPSAGSVQGSGTVSQQQPLQQQQQQEQDEGQEDQRQEEEEEAMDGEEDGEEELEVVQAAVTATDKWKLRRKLGVSLASRQRRLGARRPGASQ